MSNQDLRTRAYVLRRTNYGEADRILNLLTEQGKLSAIAKGVRKEKSKLAGNIEMFCLIDLNIHKGRGELGIITSAKMLKYHHNLVTDFNRMELATLILKKTSKASENSDSPDFFPVLDQALTALNDLMNPAIVETWFLFALVRACGEEINLYRDTSGEKLSPDKRYVWDSIESGLAENTQGNIGADEIKIMRLMFTSKLALISKVKGLEEKIPAILYIAKAINKL